MPPTFDLQTGSWLISYESSKSFPHCSGRFYVVRKRADAALTGDLPSTGLRMGHLSTSGLSAQGATSSRSAFHNVRMSPNPPIRRLKTYTGAQGYVYQYYFVGKRPALPDDPEAPATEFVFDVTSDRKLTYAVSIFLPERSRAAWSKAHGRPLNDAEQYGAVKLRLFRAFDEIEDLKTHGRRLTIDTALLEEVLASLGVE